VTAAAPRPARVSPTRLVDLCPDAGCPATGLPTGAVVTGVTLDSRLVQPGDVYAALPGAHTHGADHLAAALAAGAAAVLTDRPLPGCPVPVLVVPDPRAVLGAVSARVYGDPAASLDLYGVTGTNGKTTTAHLLEAGLAAAGHTTGLLGTIGSRVAGESLPSARTTPEAPELQALLALMVERGVTACAMEVSSHALALGRVDGCHFRAVGFTNLSQDHLDFHGDLEHYYLAKAALFAPSRSDVAVVDTSDQYGRRLAQAVRAAGSPMLVELAAEETAPTALAGSFNARNAALALRMLEATGVDETAAAQGIAALACVPGRMEPVRAGQRFTALVDYAHTPEAVAAALAAARAMTTGRVIVVLGCGGDRDRGKRPLMGAAVATGADVAVLTDDNPRSEPSAEILAAMAAGVPYGSPAEVLVIADRATAIAVAVGRAGDGDVLLVAGKGHETGQEVAGTVHPFDDRAVLRSALLAGAGA